MKLVFKYWTVSTGQWQSLVTGLRHSPLDSYLVVSLLLLSGMTSFYGSQTLNPSFFQGFDQWFDADIGRVFSNMTDFHSNHAWNSAHPLFAAVGYGFTLPFQVLGMDPITAARGAIALLSGIIISTFFILLRVLQYSPVDATLFSVLMAMTAAARFWFVVPETFLFGAETILLTLVIVAFSEHRPISTIGYVIANVLTMSMTTTNWMVGIAATVSQHRWKRSLIIIGSAIVSLFSLLILQKLIFPTAALKAVLTPTQQLDYVHLSSGPVGGLLEKLQVLLLHSIVMPSIQTIPHLYNLNGGKVMSIQTSAIGSGSIWGVMATGAWIGLLSLGIWALVFLKSHGKFRWTLGCSLVGQLILHSLHGVETFLFSMHYVPLLIGVASLSILTRLRTLAIALALILTITAGINNILVFNTATHWLNQHPVDHSSLTPSDRGL